MCGLEAGVGACNPDYMAGPPGSTPYYTLVRQVSLLNACPSYVAKRQGHQNPTMKALGSKTITSSKIKAPGKGY